MPKKLSVQKPKQLTEKEERFCREYVLCMNKSEAFRRSYDTSRMKPESVNDLAHRLTKKVEIMSRINELKEDIEGVTGISKITMLETLKEVIGRSLRGKPKMVWDSEEKSMVNATDEEGNFVYEYDSNGVNKAVQQISKMLGYDAVEKKDITSNGQTLTNIVVD